jgi:hypothetical protein
LFVVVFITPPAGVERSLINDIDMHKMHLVTGQDIIAGPVEPHTMEDSHCARRNLQPRAAEDIQRGCHRHHKSRHRDCMHTHTV